MKLSIITINYNNVDGLKKTIESVIPQSFSDFEWIIIDGGSNDGSKQLIEQYASHFSYWVSEPDKGIFNAINKGIAHANGDYIQFLHSGDCLFEPTTLEKFFSTDHEGDILYGDAVCLYPDGSSLYKHYPDTVSLNYFMHDVINHQASFFRKEVFESHPYNEKYHIAADWAYCLEAVCRGLHFNHIHQFIVYYDNSGISSKWTPRQIEERADILENYVPKQLKPDMEIIDELRSIRSHRSTAKILDNCIKFCHKWNSFLLKVEKMRKK